MIVAEKKSGFVAGIAYEELGVGLPLIFFHGLTYSRGIWKPFAEALSPDFRCILVDLPGHGGSPELAGAGDYDPQYVADRVHALALSIAADNPVIIGHSMGAAVGLHYAARYTCRAAVNFDQMLRFDTLAGLIRPAEPILRGPSFDAFWENLRSSFGIERLPDWARDLEKQYSAPKQGVVLGYWDLLLRSDANHLLNDVELTMGKVSAPYFAVHGDNAALEYTTWLQRHLPGCHLTVWPGRGHFPQLACFDQSIALLRAVSK